ncbi:hypothetical protein ABZP36_013609 [Zizania latifolia]
MPERGNGLHRRLAPPPAARIPQGPEEEVEGEEGEVEGPARRPEVLVASASFQLPETARVFEELPRVSIFAVSRPDDGDITPMLLSYTIEVHYKQIIMENIYNCINIKMKEN